MKKIVLLVGGVGGAKLAHGLYRAMPPEDLTIIVNTGDDFWHHGLRICPDLDTVMYTLSGLVDKNMGWGVAGDSTITLDALRRYNVPTWFKLGDQDLATHLLRTQRWHDGVSLTEITRRLAESLGIGCTLLPMTNGEVPTIVHTVEHGELPFQEYFVKHRWQPTLKDVQYLGADVTTPSSHVQNAIQSADAILIAPSNPWLSIRPILSLYGMVELLKAQNVPRIAITPLIQGKAIKGPTAKLMSELGLAVHLQTVMAYYGDAINGFVADIRDESALSTSEIAPKISLRYADTLMDDEDKRLALAQTLLTWLKDWKIT